MKAAKIISLIASIVYAIFWVIVFIAIFKIGSVYDDLAIEVPLYSKTAPHLIMMIIVGVNFGFFLYLRKQLAKGKEVKNALVFSLLFALIPAFFYQAILVMGTLLPIYNLTSAF